MSPSAHNEKSHRASDQLAPRLVLTALAMSSIGILLVHLPGWLAMRHGVWIALLPASALTVLIFCRSRNRNPDLRRRILLGVGGGLLGTLGYDLFRVPFHYAGMNVFAPIYAYGMWLAGAGASSPMSDAIGFVYHLSNGASFGLIYAMAAWRRSWVWGLLWGLCLEWLAVATVFGEVFGLRSLSVILVIAFVAHVFFGIPLGMVCEDRIKLPRPAVKWGCALTALGTVAMGGWFVAAGIGPADPPGGSDLLAVDGGLRPGWSDRELGDTLRIAPIEVGLPGSAVLLRRPASVPGAPPEVLRPWADGKVSLLLDQPGIYQLGLQDAPGRSVFVAVREGGDYRPRTHPLRR